jgi:hypothetical protein
MPADNLAHTAKKITDEVKRRLEGATACHHDLRLVAFGTGRFLLTGG